MSIKTIDAYVPAGTGEKLGHYKTLLDAAGVDNKAFIDLNGRPMIEYVIEALDKSKHVKSISVFGITKEEFTMEVETPIFFYPGGPTSFETTQIALKHFQSWENPPKYILILSSDIPMVTTEMVDMVVEAIDFDDDVEFYYNTVWNDRRNELYPNATKVPLKLREGNIVFGDIHVLDINVLEKGDRKQVVEFIMSSRKKFGAIIKYISWKYFIKYLLGRLSIKEAGLRLSEIFDINIAFIMASFPECCIDLDYAEDIDIFKHYMSKPRRILTPNDTVQIITDEVFRSDIPIEHNLDS